MNKKTTEVKTLFGFDPDTLRDKREILDRIAQKHGLNPGEYFNRTITEPRVKRGRRRVYVEAIILENAANRGISVNELLRNLIDAKAKMDDTDTD